MMSIFEYVPTLILIFVAWKLHKKQDGFYRKMKWELDSTCLNRKQDSSRYLVKQIKIINGKLEKYWIKAKIAEKTADRAFNMASSANLGVVALQKALAVPRMMTKQQGLQNKFAKQEVDKLFTGEGTFDWLRPLMSDEELEIIDKAEELQQKQMNGEHKI